ncbi:poly [ADP-ribose] polymerase 14-like protein [Labeo rohita]|uniref:Poly [ADP-ribose] polymerase n=1 Tax=Labeo rohita TaxID=84645 RepID=A0A498NF40_LABRO|nr:poly [ADP-ribose] polymerase 14-like protein [Labeo rohita]
MEEYAYPITVEGDWGPAKNLKNKLQIYFQSKKKSQGGDCVLQYNDGSNSATIRFKSSHIRDDVLSKAEHIITIDTQQIKLKVYKPSDAEEQTDSTGHRTEQACDIRNQGNLPDDVKQDVLALLVENISNLSTNDFTMEFIPELRKAVVTFKNPSDQSDTQTNVDVKKPQESSAVVLENLPDDVKQDVLTLLVENISSLPENEFSMELIPELRKAVVTFKNLSAAEKFLEESRTHEKFKQYNLSARALERSTCVRVEDLPVEANNNKMLLELYFEKWGGPVEEVITIPSEQAAIITFKEEEAKERVLKQENNICDVPVKIYPYFKSLDTVLYGGNRPHLKLPEPVTVSVHPAIREFILKKGQISSIKDQMSSHFCQINMDKPDILLSPDPALLKQKGVTRQLIDSWSKNGIDAFRKIISNYTTSEWPVSHALWSKVETDVKEAVKNQGFTDLDASKGVLTLAGMTHEISGLKPIIENILERAKIQMEREKNSVTEYMEISPAMYSLLDQDGLKSATAVSPDLHIDYNEQMNSLVLSGLHKEILAIKSWVIEKKINMKQKPLQTDCSVLEFLRSVDCDEMSRDLFISHGITAVYTVENGDVVVIGSTERALNEAEKRINTVLTSKELTVEDQGVLQMSEWQDLKKLLEELFNTSKKTSVLINLSKQRDKIIVTGFREPVMEVSGNLGYFTQEHTRIEETVHVKSHAVVNFLKDRKSQDWQHFTNEVKVSFDSKRPWIKLSGEHTFVEPAMTFFKRLADGLYTDTLIIKKAGAKKYFKDEGKMMLSVLLMEKRFVVVLQEDDMLDVKEGAFFQGPLGRVSTSSLGMHAMQVRRWNQNVFKRFEIEPAIFQLCGETQEDLSEARDIINCLILQEHVIIPVNDPAIAHFTRKNEEMLNAVQRELTVSVRLEKKGQDSVITLEGLTRDVHTAESRIQDMIRKVKRTEKLKHEEFLSLVQSQYQKNSQSATNLDTLTNYELEQDYHKIKPTVRMKMNKDEYGDDLCRKEITRRRLGIELNKVDLNVGAQCPLPSHWEDMKGQLVVLVQLTAGSKEYADVEKEFTATGLSSHSIITIERVQNSALWKNYMIKKEELENKNHHTNNEKLLFHGTAADKTDQINHHGFNRSFAGMHGAMYGNGSYFAVDPRRITMDEYRYPIIVEGNWESEHAKSVKNKLQIYFQSKKKSQGGDCILKYNDKNNSATILFKSPDIRDAVLSKAEHIITTDNQQIRLKVYKPSDVEKQAGSTGPKIVQESGYQEPNQSASQTDVDVKKPQESSAVVLENLPDDVKQDVLTLLVENISRLPENDFSIELIPGLRKAVVTFTNTSAAVKFLEDSRTNEKFKKNNLMAHALERSTCVQVEDLPAEANNDEMLLELYFEKWGGPVEDVITIPSEQAAIITFKEEEAKVRVLKQENKICDVPVKIYPYYKSLNTVLYGGKRPHLKLPEPITVSVHPAIREFILKKGQISFVKDQMSSHFCHINMDKPDVLLSPDPALLKHKGDTRRHIDGWSKNAIDAFKKILSNYTTSEWPVSHVLWSNVERDIRKVVKDQAFTDLDASKRVLTLAGMTHEIIGLKPIMDNFLEGATNQMEREKNSVTEYLDISPALYSLLEQDGLKSAKAVSPHLHIDYDKKMNRLVLSGLHSETLAFKKWVLEKKVNIKQKHLQINHLVLEFLRSVDCDEMSRDLFISHGITAVYTIENGDVVVIGSTESALNEAEKRINTVYTKNLTVEDHGVLQMPEWQDLKKQLENSFSTSKKGSVFINTSKERDKVTVTGFRELVMEVSEKLGCFIEKHTKNEETVRVKSLAESEFIKVKKLQNWQHFIKSNEVKVSFDPKRPWIKLSGKRTFVQSAVTLFKRLAEGLYTDTLIIKKAGAKKYFMEQGKMMLSMLLKEKRFVVVLQEDDMLDEEKDEDIGQVSCEVRIPGGVTVTVRKADICKINVDAVVNAANEDLNHSGGVALALLQAAGPSLQKNCDLHKEINGPLKPGDAIITDAGRLPCKYVVHTVGPRFGNSDRHTTVQHLRRAVRESLNQASSNKCSSIAIPVISSGIFGCPLDLCTESIAKEVREYIEDHNRRDSNSTLTEIHLVDNNGSTVNAMTEAVRKEFAFYNPKMTFPHQAKPHGYGKSGQGYHGHGPGNYSQINQEFEGHGDFEAQPHSMSGSRSDKSEELSVIESKTTQKGLKIILSKGNIQDAHADVIVNTISEDLDLSKGAVSKALLQTAGHQLQSEITRAARSKNVNYGEMVITDGCKLKCQKVFHVVCPFWQQGSGHKALIQIIRDCLETAEKCRTASVVFPAIGTGNLGFPKDLVARDMLTEIQKFKPTNLRQVTVIVHPSDEESVQCFTSIFRHGIQDQAHGYDLPKNNISGKSPQKSELVGKVSSPARGVHFMQLDQVTLKVSSGDITKEKTDAIVNSSNNTFSLKTGVSKAILEAAGVQVEQECSQIGQGGAKPADIADAMVDAVVDFVKKKKPVHVKCVKFLIFQTNMVADFHQSMIRGSGEEIEPAVFQLCGETPEDLSEAREKINSMILREHVIIPIHDPAIAHFTREDGEMLNAMQRELSVSVRLEKKGQDSVITLEGLTKDAQIADRRIQEMIRKVEMNQNRRSDAFTISKAIKWQYQESGSIQNFDILTNYDLEQAFQKRQASVRIKINNDEYEADLSRKVATSWKAMIVLKRVEL